MGANTYFIVLVYAEEAGYEVPPTLEHICTRSFDTQAEAMTYQQLFSGMRFIRTHVQWVKIDSTYGVMLNE